MVCIIYHFKINFYSLITTYFVVETVVETESSDGSMSDFFILILAQSIPDSKLSLERLQSSKCELGKSLLKNLQIFCSLHIFKASKWEQEKK